MASSPTPAVTVTGDVSGITDPRVAACVNSLVSQLNRALSRFTPTLTPSARTLMLSPNGSIFSVTVEDDGTITATKVQG